MLHFSARRGELRMHQEEFNSEKTNPAPDIKAIRRGPLIPGRLGFRSGWLAGSAHRAIALGTEASPAPVAGPAVRVSPDARKSVRRRMAARQCYFIEAALRGTG